VSGATNPRRRTPTRRDDRGTAANRVERFVTRHYLIYRFADSAASLLRTAGQPEQVLRPRVNWLNHAIDIGVGTWLAARHSRRPATNDPASCVAEAASGGVQEALGLLSLSADAARRGTSWPMTTGLWRAAGIMGFSERWTTRATAFSGLIAPLYLPTRQRRELGGTGVFPAQVGSLAAFAGVGALIADGMRRRAIDIDRRSEDLARAQVSAAARSAETELRQEVLGETLRILRQIRANLRVDPEGCAELARVEEARLRTWLEGSSTATQFDPVEVPLTEALGAEQRVRALLRVAELTIRGTAMVLFVGQIWTHRRTTRWPWFGALLGAGAISDFALVARWMRRSDDWVPHLAVAAADTLLMIGATEWEELQHQPPVAWMSAYAMSCATTTATIGTPRDGWIGPVALMGAWRAMVVYRDHSVPLRRRTARVLCETINILGNAWLSHEFAEASVEQARDLVTTTAELAYEGRRSELEAVRLAHQALVHDGAIQVLLWVGKDDLTVEQIEGWLDQEIPRVARAAIGAHDEPVTSVAASLAELAEGFAKIGVQVRLGQIDASTGDPRVRSALVEVANEALTNVLRHASYRTATVSLRAIGDELVLRIVDGGTTATEIAVGAGTGTATMRDLANMIGARIEWSVTHTGGVAVELRCPTAR
jgi:hypothetical protein